MTRITNVDQVLILLRSHLQKSERSRNARSPAARTARQKSPVERLGQIAAEGQACEEDIRRALVAGILAEEFGGDILNDARFQDVVTRVLQVMSEDRPSSQLIDGALRQLMESNG